MIKAMAFVRPIVGSALGAWSGLPLAAKALLLTVLVAAAYFAFTSRRHPSSASPSSSSRRASRSGASSNPLSPLGALVRDAAGSAKQAGSAETPYQQLLHIQWGLANLQAARRVAAGHMRGKTTEDVDAALSQSCGLHVGRLGDYLSRAQQLCTEQIERAGTGGGRPKEA